MNVVSHSVGLPLSADLYAAAVNTLTAARDVIETNWGKGYYALDANALEVEPDSPVACNFCAVGALAKVSDVSATSAENSYSMDYLRNAFYFIDEDLWDHMVVTLNDDEDTQHIHVLMAYDFAILMAEDDLAEALAEAQKK